MPNDALWFYYNALYHKEDGVTEWWMAAAACFTLFLGRFAVNLCDNRLRNLNRDILVLNILIFRDFLLLYSKFARLRFLQCLYVSIYVFNFCAERLKSAAGVAIHTQTLSRDRPPSSDYLPQVDNSGNIGYIPHS